MSIATIVFVTFLWASVLLISSFLSLSPNYFVFLRLLFSLIVVVPLALKVKDKRFSASAIISGILLSLNWIFLFHAVEIIGPSTADFIYYTAPVVSLIIAFLAGSKVPVWSWISAAVSFTGVGLIYGLSEVNSKGIFFAFLAALFYGSVVVVGKYSSMKIHPFFFTLQQLLSALFVTFIFSYKYFRPLTISELILVSIAGIVNTGVALILWWSSLKKVEIRLASVLTFLDPFFALILSIFFLNYKPSFANLMGGALIVSGGVLSIIKEAAYQDQGE